MANVLKRQLNRGDKLVLCDGTILTVTTGGYGCNPNLRGTCIIGMRAGHVIRVDGTDVNADETIKQYAKDNGWET